MSTPIDRCDAALQRARAVAEAEGVRAPLVVRAEYWRGEQTTYGKPAWVIFLQAGEEASAGPAILGVEVYDDGDERVVAGEPPPEDG